MTNYETASFRKKLIMVEELAELARKLQMAFEQDLGASPSDLDAIDRVIERIDREIHRLRLFIQVDETPVPLSKNLPERK